MVDRSARRPRAGADARSAAAARRGAAAGKEEVRRVRSSGAARPGRALPDVVRLERRPADAAELLLQQQLPDRADQGSRHDHHEMVHDVRIIRMGGEHPPKHVRPWLGDSIGRWEGDTLVVETTNFHPLQQYRGASENLKVIERFTRVGPGPIVYRFTDRRSDDVHGAVERRSAVQPHRRDDLRVRVPRRGTTRCRTSSAASAPGKT